MNDEPVLNRYIAARFPGFLRGTSDLAALAVVLETVQRLTDEHRLDLAAELVELALARNPEEPRLRLARIEIAYLDRDAAALLAAALALRHVAPECDEWPEVRALGHTLLPSHPLFAATDGAVLRWPDPPGWIEGRGELIGEALRSEFHHAVARRRRMGVLRASPG